MYKNLNFVIHYIHYLPDLNHWILSNFEGKTLIRSD